MIVWSASRADRVHRVRERVGRGQRVEQQRPPRGPTCSSASRAACGSCAASASPRARCRYTAFARSSFATSSSRQAARPTCRRSSYCDEHRLDQVAARDARRAGPVSIAAVVDVGADGQRRVVGVRPEARCRSATSPPRRPCAHLKLSFEWWNLTSGPDEVGDDVAAASDFVHVLPEHRVLLDRVRDAAQPRRSGRWSGSRSQTASDFVTLRLARPARRSRARSFAQPVVADDLLQRGVALREIELALRLASGRAGGMARILLGCHGCLLDLDSPDSSITRRQPGHELREHHRDDQRDAAAAR